MTDIENNKDNFDNPTLTKLFVTFFRIGLLTLGGGLAMATVMRHELVLKKDWLKDEEFMAEMSTATLVPGAIAVNMAYLQGRRLLGITGAIAAIAGTILPSFCIILFIAIFAMKYFSNEKVAAFLKGCGIAVTGQLAFAAFIFARRHLRNLVNVVICLIAFLAVAFLEWHPVLGVLLAGLMGLFLCKPQLPEDLEKEENKNNDFA